MNRRQTVHRFGVLDGWRGVAAICVALYHFHAYSHVLTSPFMHSAYLFVDFFFVLSGFVIAYAYGDRLTRWSDVGDFVIRRFGRLWPLHAAVLAFMFAMELAKLYIGNHGWIHFTNPPFDPAGYNYWAALPTNILLIQALHLHPGLTWNGSAWSISTEFWTYLVFAALCVWGRRALIVGAIASIAGGFAVVALVSDTMNVGYDFGFFRCIFGFFTGYFVLLIWRRWSVAPPRWIGHAELPAVAAVILFLIYAGDNFASIFAPFVFGPVVLIFAFERGAVSRAMASRPIEALGLWSYSIYMVHVAITDLVFWLVAGIEKIAHVTLRADFPGISEVPLITIGHNPWLGDAMCPLYLAVVLAVSALTFRYIERPGRDFFNTIALRRRRLQPAE
jgi:peptidoglycan/LPS O-acetylase OafA/YrhL